MMKVIVSWKHTKLEVRKGNNMSIEIKGNTFKHQERRTLKHIMNMKLKVRI